MEKKIDLNEGLTVYNKIRVISTNNERPCYGWYSEGCDVFLNLGIMKRAVVIRFALGGKYFISEGSFFSFSKKVYALRFDNVKDAVDCASKYINLWMSESIENLGL